MLPSIADYWACPTCRFDVCHVCGECPTCEGQCLCPAPKGFRGTLRALVDSLILAAAVLLAKLGLLDTSCLGPGLACHSSSG